MLPTHSIVCKYKQAQDLALLFYFILFHFTGDICCDVGNKKNWPNIHVIVYQCCMKKHLRRFFNVVKDDLTETLDSFPKFLDRRKKRRRIFKVASNNHEHSAMTARQPIIGRVNRLIHLLFLSAHCESDLFSILIQTLCSKAITAYRLLLQGLVEDSSAAPCKKSFS